MKHYFEYLNEHLPDWHMSVYQLLEHKNVDGWRTSKKTGEYEIVLGRDAYVVTAKSADLNTAYVDAMDKAIAVDKKNESSIS